MGIFEAKPSLEGIPFKLGNYDAYSILVLVSAFSVLFIFTSAISLVDGLSETIKKYLYIVSDIIYFVSLTAWIVTAALIIPVYGSYLTAASLFICIIVFVWWWDYLSELLKLLINKS